MSLLARAILLLSVSALTPAHATQVRDADGLSLNKVMKGRTVLGVPQECIVLPRHGAGGVIPHTAIIYGSGKRVWLNRPQGSLKQLDDKVILVTRTPVRRLCRQDVVELIDRYSGVPMGFVTLGQFIAYERR